MGNNPILEPYIKLTEFLGLALGPDYEIALHDLTNRKRSIVAIANGHISGRSIGAPLTNMALSVLRDRSYETTDYRLHYRGLSPSGKVLRSNTWFIKHGGRLIGMLCINFDDTRYREAGARLMDLCHPVQFNAEVMPEVVDRNGQLTLQTEPGPEQYRNSTEAVTADAVAHAMELLGVTPERMTAEERQLVIASLEKEGLFLLKGAVKEVAEALCCSQASVYRYLSNLKSEHTDQPEGN